MFIGFAFWNWQWPFKISLVPYENLSSNSSAVSYHFCCAFPVLSMKNTLIEQTIFSLDSLCSCDVSNLC